MDLTVVQISSPTEFGSVLAKMQHAVEVDTPLGTISRRITYYAFVSANALKVKVGDTIDLDLDLFNVVIRDWTHPETGEVMQLKYLYLK